MAPAPRETLGITPQKSRRIPKCNTAVKSRVPNNLQRTMATRRSLNNKDLATSKPTPEAKKNLNSVKLNPRNKSSSKQQDLVVRRPAHSGVPVPEKMKKLFEKMAREMAAKREIEERRNGPPPNLPA